MNEGSANKAVKRGIPMSKKVKMRLMVRTKVNKMKLQILVQHNSFQVMMKVVSVSMKTVAVVVAVVVRVIRKIVSSRSSLMRRRHSYAQIFRKWYPRIQVRVEWPGECKYACSFPEILNSMILDQLLTKPVLDYFIHW